MPQAQDNPAVIFHIDLDAFYASVETQQNNQLHGKPVIVGADPKDGSGRGVVMTCTYEARKFGVKSAMPISRAYELCPDGIYVRPNMKLYKTVSKRVMALIRPFADKFQQTSIDECFLDVTNIVTTYDNPIELATQIKQQLAIHEGLTCSIGISPNKPISKIASDFKKPNGITLVEPTKVREFLEPLLVKRISGVGAKTQKRLNDIGIKTIGDIQAYSLDRLMQALGKHGTYFWRIANGEGSSTVHQYRKAKSMSSESTFAADVGDYELISEKLDALTTRVHSQLKNSQFYYKTITLKIRFADFTTFSRSKSLGAYNNDQDTIFNISKQLLDQFLHVKKKIRLLGIRLSNLRTLERRQQTLTKWL